MAKFKLIKCEPCWNGSHQTLVKDRCPCCGFKIISEAFVNDEKHANYKKEGASNE